MLEEMSASLFDRWMAYYTVAPWGEERDSLHAGIIAAAAVGPHCKKGQAPKPKDFMPDFISPPKPPQKLADMKSAFRSFASAINKKRGKG